jgi:hypothetical protein
MNIKSILVTAGIAILAVALFNKFAPASLKNLIG